MKKIKLKNNKEKKRHHFIKIIIFTTIIYISYSLTFDFLINKNIDITDKKYVNYLLEKSYNKKNSKILLNEGLKLVSNIDLTKSSSLLDLKFNNKENNKYEKDATAGEDNYDVNTFEKITSYVENQSKEKDNPQIYIYNTHQLETYSNMGLDNININPNVLMVSYLLSDKLNKANINTITEDINLKEFNRKSGIPDGDFYDTTRIFIKEKINKYNSLKYFIDIHRDAVKKTISTCTINEKKYARILFVLGTKNPNHIENKKVMNKLDEISDELYPGLSRGIFQRYAIYNQDINNNIILIEIGGNENTMDEVLNTIDALSDIIIKFIKG